MTYYDTYVGHWLESIIQSLGLFFPLLWIQLSFDFWCALLFVNIRGMMRHDSRMVWLIGNHHILHHQHPMYNFGEYWLDKLCGTLYSNKIL